MTKRTGEYVIRIDAGSTTAELSAVQRSSPELLPPSLCTLAMGLFRRNKPTDDDGSPSDAPKKEKGSWRRPASEWSHLRHGNCLTVVSRYCVQAAAAQGLAAYPYAQDCFTHSLSHWYHICAHRRAVGVGEWSGTHRLQSPCDRPLTRTAAPTPGQRDDI